MIQPTPECSTMVSQVEDWLSGRIPVDARDSVENHLAVCESCLKHYQEFRVYSHLMIQLAAPEDCCAEDAWIVEFYQGQTRKWRTRSQYQALISDLRQLPETQQEVQLQNRKVFRSPQFCGFVVDEALALSRYDPREAKAIGSLAVLTCRIVRDIDPQGPERTELYVRSLILLADLDRISSDFDGAAACFKKAETIMRAEGMVGTRMWAEYLRLLGHQLVAQRRFSESARAFDESIATSESRGDLRLAGRSTVDKGTQVGEACAPSKSLELIGKGHSLMQRTIPRIRDILAVKHNSLVSLVELGRLDEARQLLPEVRTLHAERQQPDLLLRLQWVEAQLALACKDFRLAERLLLAVKAGFLDFDMPYDVALSSLHLGVLFMEEGRWSEVPPLISEMLAVFQALRIDREAIAAVLILKRAMDVERLSLRLLREAVAYFQQAQADPGIRFQPSSR